ncbi:MAG: hypothetical protein DME55_07130 [Verrucomicrobia bacterium]|nr:MAG: hypothetical protein DME55_07130 [Verrucomicrobiota bacterium]
MNLPETATEESEQRRAPKIAVLLMLIIVVCLAMLTTFTNVQRFRRGVEVVVVRMVSSATPQGAER